MKLVGTCAVLVDPTRRAVSPFELEATRRALARVMAERDALALRVQDLEHEIRKLNANWRSTDRVSTAILSILDLGPRARRPLAAFLAVPIAEVDRAIVDLIAAGAVESRGNGWFRRTER